MNMKTTTIDPTAMDLRQMRQSLEEMLGCDNLEIAALLFEGSLRGVRQQRGAAHHKAWIESLNLPERVKRAAALYALAAGLADEATRRGVGPDAVRQGLALLASDPMAMPPEEYDQIRRRFEAAVTTHTRRTGRRKGSHAGR